LNANQHVSYGQKINIANSKNCFSVFLILAVNYRYFHVTLRSEMIPDCIYKLIYIISRMFVLSKPIDAEAQGQHASMLCILCKTKQLIFANHFKYISSPFTWFSQ